jgi:hypothetical protein
MSKSRDTSLVLLHAAIIAQVGGGNVNGACHERVRTISYSLYPDALVVAAPIPFYRFDGAERPFAPREGSWPRLSLPQAREVVPG